MSQINPFDIFSDRKHKFELLENHYAGQSKVYSLVRIIIFILMIILVVYFADARNVYGVAFSLGIFLTLFIVVLRKHNKIQYLQNFNHHLKNINHDEVSRLKLDLKGFDSGSDFINKDHPYSIDLDLFGNSSLFQLINRSVTTSGRSRIAQLLQKRSSTEFILDQQEAVKELTDHIDWRQEFQAAGLSYQTKNLKIQKLLDWSSSGKLLKKLNWYSWVTGFFRTVFVLSLIAVVLGYIDYLWLIIPLFINSYILLKLSKKTQVIYEQTGKSFEVLKVYEELIRKAETGNFSSKKWEKLVNGFVVEGKKASEEIEKLGKILSGFDARNGMMYHIINPILLLDSNYVVKIEKWKEKNCSHIAEWFEIIGEIEAMASLAGFAYANPDYSFPGITDNPHILKAKELGHPLIKGEKRVANDFSFSVERQITLVTGSNMSGKSTFLRTVGVNIVLALAGSPVCAKEMEVTNMDIFTSMRTQDNLEENISSFYAELTRIKQLLELLDKGDPVIFMLDEILKGTNSKDRHKGAVALTKQLGHLNASGFISTHDLELSYLENEIKQVKNYSFESEIKNGELYFDYKIKKGVTESFNASLLMEKIGIEMGEK